MVIILISLNTSSEAAYKHVLNIVCVVIFFSSMWSFNLRSEVKTSPRYFTFRTISIDFPPILLLFGYILLSYRLILWLFDSLLLNAIYGRLFVQVVPFLSFTYILYLPGNVIHN